MKKRSNLLLLCVIFSMIAAFSRIEIGSIQLISCNHCKKKSREIQEKQEKIISDDPKGPQDDL